MSDEPARLVPMTRSTACIEIDRDVAPHRSRKDRKRWCRGKPGVEHTPVFRESKTGALLRILGRQRGEERPLCRWYHWWKRDSEGKVVPDYDSWHWTCGHERGCSTCGKIIDPSLGEGCPDYAPRG